MSMEDAYSFVVDFDGIRGQGFFAIFDGHAGPEAAEWCGNNFHIQFLASLRENLNTAIPEVMNKTFLCVDTHLSSLSSERGSSSGCTAVTAFLRVEDAQGGQSFLPHGHHDVSSSDKGHSSFKTSIKNLASSVQRPRSASPAQFESNTPRSSSPTSHHPVFETSNLGLKRVLYTANAGDARAVLCRGGKALRLTYDHKGADRQEAKRIQDAGGFVLNNRVNGVLAVTRSLGDSSMKDFVVGAPYTTETPLGDNDEFVILACDGVSDSFRYLREGG
jgi:protein phosphatase PTC1